ncbi:hypothetical protein [Bacillus glycinifermentans]|uniref:Uncharacterized protein n=1 Tax=Bacillus glycinifermentans TaxID=1664069 RepID=A0ABU6GWW6_9BACI|nr:hypothetical protein [Bacillus glycinifermentans]MEC0483272.1 hypothetical protein [Bacillus glycinifermentans]MEC0493107.1 hypothetical protein [Bacillus glycinifermentans]MEC0541407.1 hypothetical protein [Bacillus glycinifermentans]MEC3606719.1 hypothetical protein [Bacillus glycinifermentans]UOY88659.1 hypothetical protein MW696_22130 [Bacillus glycinifermentans]
MIPCSGDRFDQWRLGEAGGSIAFAKGGIPVFQFENKGQYERYVKLKRQEEAK